MDPNEVNMTECTVLNIKRWVLFIMSHYKYPQKLRLAKKSRYGHDTLVESGYFSFKVNLFSKQMHATIKFMLLGIIKQHKVVQKRPARTRHRNKDGSIRSKSYFF